MITAELLRSAIPRSGDNADIYAPHLEEARKRFVGDSWHRVAMFLAQIAHESGSLSFVRELASGEAYEGRKDLGNTQAGDGPRFRGRGLLQVTGRHNYAACGQELGLPLLDKPELLELPEYAALSAGWVWKSHALGPLCDQADPVLACTKRLNGGTTGIDDRRQRYDVAMTALKLNASSPSFTQAASTATPSPPPPTAAAPPAPTIKEQVMAIPALVFAAAQTLLPFIADLMRTRGTKTSERNADILDKAPDLAPIIMELGRAIVPDAKNEQEVVERIVASKELQTQLRAQAAVRWSDIQPFLQFEEESREKARGFAERMTASDGPQWRQIGFGFLIAVMSLTIVLGGGAMFWDLMSSPQLDPGQKGLILGALIASFTTVVGYFFGSSATSRQKDQTIAEQAKR